MRVSDLEHVTEVPISDPAAVAAKWWADTLRRRNSLGQKPDPLPPTSTSVVGIDLVAENLQADTIHLFPEGIDHYEHELALRIQAMINSGDETAKSIAAMLTTTEGPSVVHSYALRAAEIKPSMTILPWNTYMAVDPNSGVVVVGDSNGTRHSWRQLYPAPQTSAGGPTEPRNPLAEQEERIRARLTAGSPTEAPTPPETAA